MPHPYFDSTVFHWDRKEAVALHDGLTKTFSTSAAIRAFYANVDTSLDPLANAAPREMWREALDNIAAGQKLRALGSRLQGLPQNPKLYDLYLELEKAPDPLLAPGLASDVIVIDRDELSESLGKISSRGSAASVLLVRSGKSSGKTWTRHVIAELAEVLGQDCLYLCDGLVGTLGEVLANIFALLDGDIPAKATTDPAWYRAICTEMMALGGKRKKVCYIVIDDLGEDADGPRMDRQIREFCNQVGLSMLNPSFAKWFRLVLIDYPPGKVPTQWSSFWLEDQPLEQKVTPARIAEYLTRWAKSEGKLLAPADADREAQAIVARATTPDPNDSRSTLQRIHDEVEATRKVMRRK